jgi:hypothetical protein
MLLFSCRTIYTPVYPVKHASLDERRAEHRKPVGLTTTSLGSAVVIRLSSQYSQPPREEMKAVSKLKRKEGSLI